MRTVAEDGLPRASEDVNGEGLDMKNLINRFVREEEGQDLVEYALLGAFVAVATLAGLRILEGVIGTRYKAMDSGEQILWQPPNP